MVPPVLTINSPEDFSKQDVAKSLFSNIGTILYLIVALAFIAFVFGQIDFVLPSAQPAVSVQMKDGYCPSIEVEAGKPITWVNEDSVNRALIIEPASEQGFFFKSVSAHVLQPGDMVALSLRETGEYKYYCSMNRQLSGKITVIK